MDILIRNLPDKVVQKIDRKNAELNQINGTKMSRNEYIKNILTNNADKELETYLQNEYVIMIKNQTELLKLASSTFANAEKNLWADDPNLGINLLEKLSQIK